MLERLDLRLLQLAKYSNKYILENGDFLIGMDGDFRLAIWNGGKALC